MKNLLLILGLIILCGCAGKIDAPQVSSRQTVAIDGDFAIITFGEGDEKRFDEEVKYFIAWWEGETKRVKNSEGINDEVVVNVKDVMFYKNYEFIILRINTSYKNEKFDAYIVIYNKNHKYAVFATMPIFPDLLEEQLKNNGAGSDTYRL